MVGVIHQSTCIQSNLWLKSPQLSWEHSKVVICIAKGMGRSNCQLLMNQLSLRNKPVKVPLDFMVITNISCCFIFETHEALGHLDGFRQVERKHHGQELNHQSPLCSILGTYHLIVPLFFFFFLGHHLESYDFQRNIQNMPHSNKEQRKDHNLDLTTLGS